MNKVSVNNDTSITDINMDWDRQADMQYFLSVVRHVKGKFYSYIIISVRDIETK